MAKMKKCFRCGKLKNISEFRHYDKAKTRLHSYCITCFYEVQTIRLNYRKVKAIQYLGGKCQDCGGKFHPIVYDFHHLDPDTKEFGWGKLRIKQWDAITNELDKCILLCSNCHRIRHTEDVHKSKYSKSHWFGNGELLKFCQSCLKFKNRHTSFRKKGKSCIRCISVAKQQKKINIKKRLVEIYQSRCGKCKKSFHYAVYDFHHLDSNTKDSIISKYGRFEDAFEESKKCVMLCPNCHTLEHIIKKNWDFNNIKKEIKKRRQIKNLKENRFCKQCGSKIKSEYAKTYCSRQCAYEASQKVDWPENLPELVENLSKLTIAKSLGVSDKAVAKRLITHHQNK